VAHPAIRVQHLSKRYEIGAVPGAHLNRTFREAVTDAATAPLRRLRHPRPPSRATSIWALKDVSFEVEPGEVVGIIGPNGAGKSTLLKILSQITEPAAGRVELMGRVASLLEVGTGFHPELTGRENIYLNGAILGMTRREIQSKLDAIVSFAEVERFIETPVKRYSSGMYLRLAFAVAAHLEPEILLVDEVLAVGDAAFQKKCLGKMGEVAHDGRTVLFVSHNMAAVRALCRRGLLIQNARVAVDADAETAIAEYLAEDHLSSAVQVWEPVSAPRSPEIRFTRAYVLNDRMEYASTLDCRKEFVIGVEYEVLQTLNGLRIGFFLQRADGTPMCGSNDPNAWPQMAREPGAYVSHCRFPGYVLNEGTYSLFFGADVPPYVTPLVSTPYCLSFTIQDVEGHGPLNERLPGVVRPRLEWRVNRLTEHA
jgi:lipopolysaccharide transport system ATP-binding protein